MTTVGPAPCALESESADMAGLPRSDALLMARLRTASPESRRGSVRTVGPSSAADGTWSSDWLGLEGPPLWVQASAST